MSRQKVSKKEIDRQFEAFLKESISTDESLESGRLNALLRDESRSASWWAEEKPKQTQPWWMTENRDEEADDVVGLSGTGRNFLKKKTLESSGQQSRESLQLKLPTQSYDSNLSKDSLDTHNLAAKMDAAKMGIPHLSLDSSTTYTEPQKDQQPPGMDTLDELRDKESFFKNLEEHASSLDYHELNRDLDQSETLHPGSSPDAKVGMTEVSAADQVDSAMKPSMLDNVALLDSLDQTLGTTDYLGRDGNHGYDIVPDDNGRLATGTGVMGTGLTTVDTSEMAALHQAYQLAAHSSLGTNQIKSGPVGTLRSAGSLANEASEVSNTRDTDAGSFGLRNIGPGESGGPDRTVDDILREVAEIEDKVQLMRDQSDIDVVDAGYDAEGRGFDLSPVHAVSERMMHDDYDLVRVVEHSPDPKNKHQAQQERRPEPAVRRSQSSEGRKEITGKAQGKVTKPTAKSPSIGLKKKSSTENLAAKKDSTKSPAKPTKKAVSETEVKRTIRKTSPVKRIGSPKKRCSPTDRSHGNRPTGDQGDDGDDDDKLQSSVETFARYIRSNFTDRVGNRKSAPEVRYSLDEPTLSNSLRVEKVSYIERENVLMDEVKEWQERWKEERRMLAKAKAELGNLEKECKRHMELDRLEHQEEMFKLKQENFVLAAKISDQEERSKHAINSSTENLDDITRLQLSRLEKEIQEQEKLILGYQQENEKLYSDLKKKQITSKGAEEKMFNENQRLTTEVMNLRSQLEQREIELKNKGVITAPSVQRDLAAGTGTAIMGAGRIAQLEADLKQAQKREFDLEQQLKVQDQSKRDVELQLERLFRERDVSEDKVQMTRTEGDHVVKVLKHDYELEIEKLNKKLRWYAENQDLLDRDVTKLKRKDEEIDRLKEKIEEITTETGRKKLETKARLKERTADAKRIMDLERQVKELEGILRKRNPNSLPALMYAASGEPVPRTPSIEYLENQVRRLEKELESRDEDDKRDIRVLEQRFQAMKLQYEERVEELEKQVTSQLRPSDHPHTHAGALQKELESVRERSRKTLGEKEAEIERLSKEMGAVKARYSAEERKELTRVREAESELELRVKALQLELVNKDNRAKTLEEEIRKLKTEKDLMVIDSVLHQERHMKEAAKNQKKKKSKDSPKEYEPDQFKGLHISEVVKDNEDLRLQLDRCQLELNQQRVDLSKALAEKESSLRMMQDELEDQIASLKKSHKSDIEHLVTQHAMYHSDSKVAELQAKLETQELMLSHLKEQYADAKHKADEVSVLRIREAALNSQVQQLLMDLRDSKRNHTPEMHHYDELLNKIRQLESRQSLRDSDLEQIIDRNKRIATANMEKENTKWRKIVEVKNEEVRRFRQELDSMLEVLRELKRQGVVMPSYKLKT